MDFEPNVKKYFEKLGFTTEKILESDEKTPDFFVYDEDISFLVELKTKFPSDTQIGERRRLLERGLFHNFNEKVIRKNKISGIVRQASKQLRNYGKNDIFRLVFLHSVGHLEETRYHQFKAALYGSTTILDRESMLSRPCLFFYDSDFYRHRAVLDAGIIFAGNMQSLLLNPYSSKYNEVEQSSLVKKFVGNIINPVELEQQGKIYLVDGEVDRGDEDLVLNFLRHKYNSQNLIKVDMSYLSGTVQY